MHIDIDATLVLDHSDNKEVATPTWKKSFGLHPLLAFLDRPEIAGGKALAGLLRTGRAGSNTAADHITVLDEALASLPSAWRPDPGRGGDRDAPKVLVRCDSAGPPTISPARAALPEWGFPSATRWTGGSKTPTRDHPTWPTRKPQPAHPRRRRIDHHHTRRKIEADM
ncbi:putative transposase [Mycobacterium kansasii 824]|uniref:Putative transposase n=1 Tax=Mycobacterium kansasii TaxID=1768 RepID=A0A1V3WYR9_MYCKA|nr:putative transposase [Mycobacterium kansasii 824]OOK71972.1 putative transposase [Mycobacterium kansasii]